MKNTLKKIIDRTCRYEVNHRQFCLNHAGCGWGFITKSSSKEDYINRTMFDYVGIYVLRGHGRYVDYLGESHEVGPGDLMHLPPGKPHSVCHEMDGQWAEYYFSLPTVMYESLHRMQVFNPQQSVWHVGLHIAMIQQCENQLAMLHQQENEAWLYAQVSISAVNLIMSAKQLMLKQMSPTQQQLGIMQARQKLEEDWQAQIKLKDIARELNMSYERFRKLFKQFVGHAPGEFRILRRIDRAKILLLKQYSVAQIANELGYPDQFSLSKQFKRYTGMSPTQFRQTI
ncbi:MAG: AraC family transcriptional regulator [Phycisphaeraceae bacterium]|nr:AraC family transcriptional regulator [Phycisphaeraceae bacterium]